MFGCPGGGPAAEPTSAYTSLYSDAKIQVNWTNGDETAFTVIYRDGAEIAEAEPESTSYPSAYFDGVFEVAHRRNGVLSALVLAESGEP